MNSLISPCFNSSVKGFTLVELLIAMALNLVIFGGVVSVFIGNQQSYHTNKSLGEVQDASRTGFEFLSKSIRNAGLTGCGNTNRIANVLKNGPSNGGTIWWANWDKPIVGYDDASKDPALVDLSTALAVAGTNSIALHGVDGGVMSVLSNDNAAATFKLQETSTSVAKGDLLMVCDPDHSAVFQATNYSPSSRTVTYDTSPAVSPGNCSKSLAMPTVCSGSSFAYVFGQNSQIAKVEVVDWYIGINSAGGRSLYRLVLENQGNQSIVLSSQEVVRNVTDMKISYLLENGTSFVSAVGVDPASWADVNAVQITLALQSGNTNSSLDNELVHRTFTATVTLRNRVN